MHPSPNIHRLSVPVVCHGLKTDSRGQIFPGSESLMVWADHIEEIKSMCTFCTDKAVFNLLIAPAEEDDEEKEESVRLGTEDTYVGVCKSCFYKERKHMDPHLRDYTVHTYHKIVANHT